MNDTTTPDDPDTDTSANEGLEVAVKEALGTLRELLKDENHGYRLEAAREIVRYDAQIRPL